MSRGYDVISGQLAFGEPVPPSPRIRRALRRGPQVKRTVISAPRSTGPGSPPEPPDRPLAEWHDMTPGERTVIWTGLRAWVTWLQARYELAVEERLPRCWPLHPGLIEELLALKAWREEIYACAQPSGQAARYWHAELRQVVQAATTMYAAGCRTGHRRQPGPDPALQQQWAAASPMTGIPASEVVAGQRSRTGEGWISHAAMGAAFDTGRAQSLPHQPDIAWCADRWWSAASAGWIQVDDPDAAARLTDSPSVMPVTTRPRGS
jgi:hypothetical protein